MLNFYNGPLGNGPLPFLDGIDSNLDMPTGLANRDHELLVSNPGNGAILAYDGVKRTFLGTFHKHPSLGSPEGGVKDVGWSEFGDVLGAAVPGQSVFEFNANGDFIRAFDCLGVGGTPNAWGIAHGPPDGPFPDHIFVSDNNRVVRIDPNTENCFVFATTVGLTGARGLTFGPDGNLYVSSFNNDRVNRFNGVTGEFIGVFAQNPALDGPTGLTFGPDGNLYVSSFNNDSVLCFNGVTGEFIRVVASGPELDGPQDLLFLL
jgi:WD40 repeat protein